MTEPLIHGQSGPPGEDYLLQFYENGGWSWNFYILYYALAANGGSALAELQDTFDNAFEYVDNSRGYPLGNAIAWRNEDYELIPAGGSLENGVEIVLRYTNLPSLFSLYLSISLNGDHNFELLYGDFEIDSSGELEVRIFCTQKQLKVTVAGVTTVDLDPANIDWEWVGRPDYYWLFLYAEAPYVDALKDLTPHSKESHWTYFRASEVPHIREISYYTAAGGPALFFTDFVRSFERS